MPEPAGTPSTIVCAACGFSNSTTSLYCQDCGARLVAPPSAIAEEEAQESGLASGTPSKPPRILSVRREGSGSILKWPLLILGLAALLAVGAGVYLAFQPPTDLPPESPPLAPPVIATVRANLEQCVRGSRNFDAPWPSLNSYLATTLQLAQSGGAARGSFDRVQVGPAGAGFSLFVSHRVGSRPVISTVDYQLVVRGNGLAATPTRVAIGRLPLPLWIAPAVESLSDGLPAMLRFELSALSRARNVRVSPDRAFFDFSSQTP